MSNQITINYCQVGDYKIPNLVLPPKEANVTLGKWGMLHKDYLLKNKKVLFTTLLTQGKLYQHCAEIENQAREMYDTLIELMKEAEGVTEQLKEENQMEWVCRMQNIEARAREVVREKYPEIPNLPIDKAVYGQESQVEFRQRAENALSRILSESEQDETIAIVSHGGMINQLYRSFFNMPIDCINFFNTADTGIHIWSLTDRERRVIKANFDEHTKGI